MDYFDLISRRQSIRRWQPRAVNPEQIQAILKAANRAPSAGNCQAFEIYVTCNEDARKRIAGATFDQGYVASAPAHLVFCTHASRCEYPGRETYALEDTTIACTFAMMAVTALGLSTVWIGAFDPEGVAKAIGCAEGEVPIAILPIGYADEQPEFTKRRPLSDVVHEIG